MTSNWFVNMAYFIAAIVFIFGLKAMASPVTARKGVVWAGYAMIGATVATFFIPDLHNIGLMVVAIVLGGGVAWYSGKVVKMTDMPQMVAIYNGMGGGAAAGIAAIEL
ncbi:MAG TPA: NAD(P)(+) transhydrogenase (Re/Si-specific) subunit beta, partial [Thauera aminoaromatica]|nr:NAD(P)(+) transhydrogenase (Re/Si-specific) subunit beta [Thauera aminoaromatica]